MGRAAMKSSFCWAVTLVGCLVLSFLYQAESARQNHGLVGKGREHSHHGPHQHHHDSGRPVGGTEQEEFEGDVLPGREESLALAATGSNLQTLEIFESHRQDTRAGLYDYFTSLFSKQSDNRAEETSVSGRAQTNCHLSPDKNECRTAGGNARADPLATAVRSLGAVFSGKPSISAAQGQEILPADESGKPAEVDPAGHKKGAAGLSLSKPSAAGKKILPADEGTKPAELDPANHKEWGEPLAEKRILPADEGSKGSSWAGLVPSIVKALTSVRTPGHAGIDVSTPSLRRPSADGKKIIPTDEGKGDHPPPQQIGVVGGARTGGAQGDGLSAAYSDTRARMLISAGSPSTSTVAQEFLAAHNAARSQVGVQPINWNTTLAVFAQQWANYQKVNNSCAMAHRPTSGPYKRIYGENIAWNGGFKSSATQITNLWAAEVAYYNATSNTCTPGKVCGHYTAIVWKKSTQMGCAVVACPDPTYRMSQFWVCNYWPVGNIVGQRPY